MIGPCWVHVRAMLGRWWLYLTMLRVEPISMPLWTVQIDSSFFAAHFGALAFCETLDCAKISILQNRSVFVIFVLLGQLLDWDFPTLNLPSSSYFTHGDGWRFMCGKNLWHLWCRQIYFILHLCQAFFARFQTFFMSMCDWRFAWSTDVMMLFLIIWKFLFQAFDLSMGATFHGSVLSSVAGPCLCRSTFYLWANCAEVGMLISVLCRRKDE